MTYCSCSWELEFHLIILIFYVYLLYKGYAAGSHHAKGGSGSNLLCLPDNPQWKNYIVDHQGHTGEICGIEYELYNSGGSRNNIFSETNNGGRPLLDNPAPWEVGPRLPWFQQEHSVRTAGPHSTQDISSQNRTMIENAAATFAGMRHRRSQLVEQTKTTHWSTLFKSFVDHCHVHCIPLEESWPVSFALNE